MSLKGKNKDDKEEETEMGTMQKKSLLRTTTPATEKQSSIKSTKSNKSVEHIVVYLPANYPSCPPGLEKLIPVNHLFVRQGIRQTEPPYTMISKNKFEVLDGEGNRIFLAKDSADNILKMCCRGGCGQPFRMSIKEKNSGYEILAVNSHPDCYGAMSASIAQNGMNLGFLNEELRCCSSNYIVIDAQGNEIFRIYDMGSSSYPFREQEVPDNPEISREADEEAPKRPCLCPCLCNFLCSCTRRSGRKARNLDCSGKGIGNCLDSCISLISGGVEFAVYSTLLGEIVGKMTKNWEHLYDTHFNLVDCFGVNFPRDLSVRHKALILGALFMLVIGNSES